MSSLSEKILSKTSVVPGKPALLVLEDGTVYRGKSCAAEGEVFGEICFNTSCIGYLEVISDPSYAGQIITLTYPQVGNYGVNKDDLQSQNLALRGLVVHRLNAKPSNWRSETSLPDFLREEGVVAVEDIDTRDLTRHIRDNGAQRAVISTIDTDVDSLLEKVKSSPSIVGENMAKTVSCHEAYEFKGIAQTHEFALGLPPQAKYHVVAYDCGAKRSILSGLAYVGCRVTVVPWNTPAETVLAMNPDGVFLSNGPGDPDAVTETYSQVEKLLGKVPLFGICLGHQMICKAAGAQIEKLKFGHRGGNQPVMNLRTRRVEITAQNHGFGLMYSSMGELLPEFNDDENVVGEDLRGWVEMQRAPIVQNEKFGRVQLTHVNLNDGTAEGIAFLDIPAFSVQYHPEASPGATDAHYLFTAFTRLMEGKQDYLDIDIAQDRMAGWTFGSSQEVQHA